MARARPGLETAINEILLRHGTDGRRLSFRQAERRTGLSPATIGELAKGNARTPETVRRFAQGMGEDAARLLLLAGFAPEPAPADSRINSGSASASEPTSSLPAPLPSEVGSSPGLSDVERGALHRLAQALSRLPPGQDRELWNTSLHALAALMERFSAGVYVPGAETTRSEGEEK